MADPQAHHERWLAIVILLSKEPGVTYDDPRSKTFGRSALKVDDKVFSLISLDGHFVVKLPEARVDALAATSVGIRLSDSQGRPMKEWLQVESDSEQEWLQLAKESLNFVSE